MAYPPPPPAYWWPNAQYHPNNPQFIHSSQGVQPSAPPDAWWIDAYNPHLFVYPLMPPWICDVVTREINTAVALRAAADLTLADLASAYPTTFYDGGDTLRIKRFQKLGIPRRGQSIVQIVHIMRPDQDGSYRGVIQDGQTSIKCLFDKKLANDYEQKTGRALSDRNDGAVMELQLYHCLVSPLKESNEDKVTFHIFMIEFLPGYAGCPILGMTPDSRVETNRWANPVMRGPAVGTAWPTRSVMPTKLFDVIGMDHLLRPGRLLPLIKAAYTPAQSSTSNQGANQDAVMSTQRSSGIVNLQAAENIEPAELGRFRTAEDNMSTVSEDGSYLSDETIR